MLKRIGIRREDKNRWERRVPLVPEDVRKLVSDHGLAVSLQPSKLRIYPDDAYLQAGARISEDLSDCELVVGVKEIPLSLFRAGGMYMFFSHTIKGQKHNIPLLKRLHELNCSLIDYERIVDDKGTRLVFFGRYAGLAGMIDSLWALGKRLASEGIDSPFESVKMAHEYPDLAAARVAITGIGAELRKNGIPAAIKPLVVGFAGYGNVSKGAQEIFDLLPHRLVTPAELLAGPGGDTSRELIKVVFREENTVRPKDPTGTFSLQEFFTKPAWYQGDFRKYLDHLTVLLNCIFWTPAGPRLITIDDSREIWGEGCSPKLKVIGDISCDIEGAIQMTVKVTQPDNPVYVYNPEKMDIQMGFEGPGPVVMAVDNLPCELPAESSQAFSSALMPFMCRLGTLDPAYDLLECGLPPSMRRAVLLWHGQFPPDYAFMEKFLK